MYGAKFINQAMGSQVSKHVLPPQETDAQRQKYNGTHPDWVFHSLCLSYVGDKKCLLTPGAHGPSDSKIVMLSETDVTQR